MSEMVERVARALADQSDFDPEDWRFFAEKARAAIAAMREPTQEMAYAALRDYDLGSLGIERYVFTNTDPRLAPAIYRGMIDEALK